MSDTLEYVRAFVADFAPEEEDEELRAVHGMPLSLQQAGLHLLDTLMHMGRELCEASPDPEVLVLGFDTLELHLNALFESEAQVMLYGHGGHFFLNQEPLKLEPQARWQAARFWRSLEDKGLGGMMVMGATEGEQIQSFFRELLSPEATPSPTKTLYPLSLGNVLARIDAHEREQVARRSVLRADLTNYALSLYIQLLQWVQQRYNPLTARPDRKVAMRLFMELGALLEGKTIPFLGFRSPGGPASYQPFHATNTAILAMLFGEALRLSRRQRLELAHVTLEHDIGKLDLPPELLLKKGPLSEQEHKTIEMLPVRSVQRLLAQRFDWSRLKHAMIALDVRLRPLPPSENSGDSGGSAFAADPTLFFSRIISLCACFDALCSERPFRPAMEPDAALAFMQGTLADQFDPNLLRRFCAFLLPMVQEATGRIVPPSTPPMERASSRQSTPPVIQELQRELREFRDLKCIPHRDPEQEQRLEFLKRYLVWKLKAAANT